MWTLLNSGARIKLSSDYLSRKKKEEAFHPFFKTLNLPPRIALNDIETGTFRSTKVLHISTWPSDSFQSLFRVMNTNNLPFLEEISFVHDTNTPNGSKAFCLSHEDLHGFFHHAPAWLRKMRFQGCKIRLLPIMESRTSEGAEETEEQLLWKYAVRTVRKLTRQSPPRTYFFQHGCILRDMQVFEMVEFYFIQTVSTWRIQTHVTIRPQNFSPLMFGIPSLTNLKVLNLGSAETTNTLPFHPCQGNNPLVRPILQSCQALQELILVSEQDEEYPDNHKNNYNDFLNKRRHLVIPKPLLNRNAKWNFVPHNNNQQETISPQPPIGKSNPPRDGESFLDLPLEALSERLQTLLTVQDVLRFRACNRITRAMVHDLILTCPFCHETPIFRAGGPIMQQHGGTTQCSTSTCDSISCFACTFWCPECQAPQCPTCTQDKCQCKAMGKNYKNFRGRVLPLCTARLCADCLTPCHHCGCGLCMDHAAQDPKEHLCHPCSMYLYF